MITYNLQYYAYCEICAISYYIHKRVIYNLSDISIIKQS